MYLYVPYYDEVLAKVRRKITISDEVWEEIARRGSFGETEDTVLRRVFDLNAGTGKLSETVGQSRESGARANAWGRETADKIARQIGAKKINPNANEYRLDDQTVTIRCARSTTNTVGVTYKMLERIDRVIAALENDAGQFELYSLSPSQYSDKMRGTRSTGPSAGRVGMVRVSEFRNNGQHMETVTID